MTSSPASKVSSCLLLASLLLPNWLFAFPPAPGVVVFGIARDSQGALVGGPNAYVIFKSGETEIAKAALKPGVTNGESYRALLPSDMTGGGDGYRDGILDASLPFTAQVEIGQKRFDPIEVTAEFVAPDQPGSALRFDFSLGTDSDGDGLPDEWEHRLLGRLGFQPGDAGYTLDAFASGQDYDEDGLTDRQEYLAGTFAYLDVDSLSVTPQAVDGEGRFRISLLAVAGAAYEVHGSEDGVLWEPLQFWIEGDESLPTGLVSAFEATDTRILTASIKKEDVERLAVFRLKLY